MEWGKPATDKQWEQFQAFAQGATIGLAGGEGSIPDDPMKQRRQLEDSATQELTLEVLRDDRRVPLPEGLQGLESGIVKRIQGEVRLADSNALPRTQSLDWSACVDAFTPEHQAKLAAWRGHSAEFTAWLHARQIVGLYDGDRIAFAVHDAHGNVIACHYRRKEDGSWRYSPTGTRTAPLIIGDLATAKTVFAFESQWDFCAVADKLGWHVEIPAYTAAAITRGANRPLRSEPCFSSHDLKR